MTWLNQFVWDRNAIVDGSVWDERAPPPIPLPQIVRGNDLSEWNPNHANNLGEGGQIVRGIFEALVRQLFSARC